MIDFYLLHYKTHHFKFQVENIKKYVTDESYNIYITVDSDIIDRYNEMIGLASSVANVILMPFPRLTEEPITGWHISSSEYGLACNFIYNNYIKRSNNISVMMENDVFFYDRISISDYLENYQIVGNIRIDYTHLPKRIYHFWPGFLIFNVNFDDKEIFGLRHIMIHDVPTDSGGESYYWLHKNKKFVKNIKYFGESENYSPFTSTKNEGKSANIEDLPDKLKYGYKNEYSVVLLDDKIIHLEGIGKTFNYEKIKWLSKVV